ETAPQPAGQAGTLRARQRPSRRLLVPGDLLCPLLFESGPSGFLQKPGGSAREAATAEDGAGVAASQVEAEHLGQNRDQGDLTFVAGLDLPAQARLVADAQQTAVQVEVVRQKQKAQVAGSQPREQAGEEQADMPIVS